LCGVFAVHEFLFHADLHAMHPLPMFRTAGFAFCYMRNKRDADEAIQDLDRCGWLDTALPGAQGLLCAAGLGMRHGWSPQCVSRLMLWRGLL
jgi:hypothetical protein